MFPDLTIRCPGQWLWKFNTLLQKGVQVKCLANRSLMALLQEEFHLDNAYIRERIQTITLDNQPVDDPAIVKVPEGATLAISGAMPGLVGATLRKGGYYAAMRSSISCAIKGNVTQAACKGLVTVKLFNLILKDLAADFLCRGIGVSGTVLAPLLDELLALPAGPSGAVVRISPELNWPSMRDSCLKAALVFVSVNNDERRT